MIKVEELLKSRALGTALCSILVPFILMDSRWLDKQAFLCWLSIVPKGRTRLMISQETDERRYIGRRYICTGFTVDNK